MPISIEEQFKGDWEGLVDFVCAKIKKKAPKEFTPKEKKFRKWFLTKEYWGYKFDEQLIFQCYKLYRSRIQTNFLDIFLGITGAEGIGKSTIGIQIASLVDPEFIVDDVCLTGRQLTHNMRIGKRGKAIVCDESATMGLFSREAMSRTNKEFVKLFTTIRKKGFILIVVVPNFFYFDTYLREQRIISLIHMRRRGYYRFFNEMGLIAINRFGKKTKNVMAVRMPLTHFFDGTNREPFPSNFDGEAYEDKKDEGIQMHLDKAEQVMEEELRLVPISDASSILGSGDARTTLKILGDYGIKVYTIGNKYKIKREDIQTLKDKIESGVK